MAEYIEREAVMQKFADHVKRSNNGDFASTPTWNQAVQIVEDSPAADVRSVGLCKDCVYSNKWYADRLICYLWNEHNGNAVFEDGFCNYGKKKEENGRRKTGKAVYCKNCIYNEECNTKREEMGIITYVEGLVDCENYEAMPTIIPASDKDINVLCKKEDET